MIVNKHKDHPSLPINTFSSSPPSSRLQRLQTLFYHLLFIPFPKAWTDAAHVGDFFNFLPFCLSSLARTIERERETAKANNSRPARACEAKGWEFSCMHPHTHTNEISTKSSSLHPSISCKTECVSPPPLSLSLSYCKRSRYSSNFNSSKTLPQSPSPPVPEQVSSSSQPAPVHTAIIITSSSLSAVTLQIPAFLFILFCRGAPRLRCCLPLSPRSL